MLEKLSTPLQMERKSFWDHVGIGSQRRDHANGYKAKTLQLEWRQSFRSWIAAVTWTCMKILGARVPLVLKALKLAMEST